MITSLRAGILVAIVSFGLACTAADAGQSGLRVPPADTFLLGGDQRLPMNVSGRNVGPTAVTVLARSGGRDVAIATVAPGGTFRHQFAVGETALIRNLSATTESQVDVKFSGAMSGLSMRYTGVPR